MNPFNRLYGTPTDRSGFTLLELLVSMAILAIGILAVMAMQYSALAGYTAAREATAATEMARTVEQVIQAEARAWESGTDPGNTTDATYLSDAFADSGSWTSVHDDPITLRLNEVDDATDLGGQGDDGPQRFCVYVAGEQLVDSDYDGDAADQQDDDFARIGIAVVYPAANTTLDDCSDPDGNLDSGDREALELQGYRAVHISTGVKASPSRNDGDQV